jgi:hypothetical protein
MMKLSFEQKKSGALIYDSILDSWPSYKNVAFLNCSARLSNQEMNLLSYNFGQSDKSIGVLGFETARIGLHTGRWIKRNNLVTFVELEEFYRGLAIAQLPEQKVDVRNLEEVKTFEEKLKERFPDVKISVESKYELTANDLY